MQVSKSSVYKLNQHLGYPAIVDERDACGVGFLVHMNQKPSNRLVIQALSALKCMEHRGACSSDGVSGDGSGITTQIPWKIINNDIENNLSQSIEPNHLGVAMIFLPSEYIEKIKQIFQWIIEQNGFKIILWRPVPVDEHALGQQAFKNKPSIYQCIIHSTFLSGDSLERALFILRKKIEKNIAQSDLNFNKQFYFCSFSSRLIIYKGMVRSEVLGQFYKDLSNPLYCSNFAVYHRRFSTNTMPKWSLAQPMRFISHNGEINTLLGNLNWIKSKEDILKHKYWANCNEIIKPITNIDNSDSANLDAAVELLIASGRSPQEALMILIPEAYDNQPELKNFPEIIDFYEYYAGLQEPWDGPALIVFTDGKVLGATLDRNGLRPARYSISSDGFVILSSESGVLELTLENIIRKGRLGPGQMLCVDMINKTIIDNLTIKQSIASKFPYRKWLTQYQQRLHMQPYLNDLNIDALEMVKLHTAFGYTSEDVELVIEHMASLAKEPTFCMGDDTPLAVLSDRSHIIYNYFKQRFAQVTNPAIDPLRESLVMSLTVYIGSKGNILEPSETMARSIKLKSPIINENELLELFTFGFEITKVSTFFNKAHFNLHQSIDSICQQCLDCVKKGIEIIVLTDKLDRLTHDHIFIPPLLAVGAVHHYLIDQKLREKVTLVIETAQCWNTHHFGCLIGYGASAICPYMAFKTVRQWWHQPRTQKLMEKGKLLSITLQKSQDNYRLAIESGLLKILSKMGISLLSSYHGAQIFEILGLSNEVVQIAFRGTASRLSGLSLQELYSETQVNYDKAFLSTIPKKLLNLGYVQYRPSAEYHVNNPAMSKTLHKAVRSKDNLLYSKYKSLLEDRPPTNLRDLLALSSTKPPLKLNEVESVESIVLRFCTGGMSLGALSRETHETLAIAMNRIGGKSNSGEGGEDKTRFYPIQQINALGTSEAFPHLKGLEENDIANSAIKQIASGRFGVTPEYLMNAKQLEIKIAQGAKPGEGGQLPGKKVSNYIAELRSCKPGVTLISPPPHHDIYSIEDLAQLIFDLHQINPNAQVSVKLVSEIGIGTVATGVAKGNADIIQISGHDGGTGASPLSSIKSAGSPWELGLTEVHQALVENNLRDKVLLRVDGGLRTGKDLIIAAIMGAEEFGFGTVAMIATGCVMARICHTNNCPVGVATQRKDLRSRYPGIPSDLVNFFIFIAQEVRYILADLGYKNLQEIIGQSNLLKLNEIQLKKTNNLNLDGILYHNKQSKDLIYPKVSIHSNGLVLDDILLNDPDLLNAILNNGSYVRHVKVVNTDRTIGSRISGKIAQKYGNEGFQGLIHLIFQGTVGQSFGAFICKGMKLTIFGEANDYVGKGMSGGQIIILPPKDSTYIASQQVILGNTCLYGATGGTLFANGQAGERFAVRNSCSIAVVEGVGDHPCEYMTGGIIIVLGLSGRNIGAGMTGGIAYFLDESQDLLPKVNQEIIKIQKIVTREGEKQLLDLIKKYAKSTNSIKAGQIISRWNDFLPMFWQLVPPSESSNFFTNPKLSSFEALSNQ
uniref:Ferredoxin-dependent glutamate synthase n=1 Tax=Calliarthron tuberculosum TaxID=48942 RepID=M4IV25_CALTB|nr:ferredoxin-dependent glutamate synthase [Calliarthron tuberculosum]AGA63924.1 ferredoxin-dependent glutamate synthase [Calliarthron tuberculosum]